MIKKRIAYYLFQTQPLLFDGTPCGPWGDLVRVRIPVDEMLEGKHRIHQELRIIRNHQVERVFPVSEVRRGKVLAMIERDVDHEDILRKVLSEAFLSDFERIEVAYLKSGVDRLPREEVSFGV